MFSQFLFFYFFPTWIVYTVSVTTKHRGSECATCVQNDVSEIVVIVTLFDT